MKVTICHHETQAEIFSIDLNGSDADVSGVHIGHAIKMAIQTGVDLSGADLSFAQLAGEDLSGLQLHNVVFDDANLCGVDLSKTDLTGSSMRYVKLNDANLTEATLTEVDLDEASLVGINAANTNLNRVYLSNAVCRGHDFTGANLSQIPEVPRLHQQVYASASQPGALCQKEWHLSDKTHSWAGWIVKIAGEEGQRLEAHLNTPDAACLILIRNDPSFDVLPDFAFLSDREALQQMKDCAEREGREQG